MLTIPIKIPCIYNIYFFILYAFYICNKKYLKYKDFYYVFCVLVESCDLAYKICRSRTKFPFSI